jgi:hypothetical protein
MSTIPVVRQVRRDYRLTDGSLRFEVTSTVIDQGDLPFPHLFVLTIGESADPKDDVLARIATPTDIRRADPTSPTYVKVVSSSLIRIGPDPFARIANVNDVSKLPRDRTEAQRQGFTEYLTTAISLIYDNVTTADAAAKQIIARLSTLTTDWRSYNTEFSTNPYEDYTLPQPGISVESERTAVYVTKRNTRIEAEAARDALQVQKNQCELGCTADKKIYDFLVVDVAQLQQARSIVLGQANGTYNSFTIAPAILTPAGPFVVTLTTTDTRDFALQTGLFAGNNASYQAMLTRKTSELAVYAEKVRLCEAQCAALSAQLLEAQQVVDAATSAERAALAAVIAVCPTFDPASV